MRKKSIWLILILIAFCMLPGCKTETQGKPDPLLTKDEMIEITTDIQLVEAALSYRRNLGLDFRNTREEYYALLFEKHHITAKIYEDNLNYYNRNPQIMEDIYEAVLQNLELFSSDDQANDTLKTEQNLPDGAR